LQNLIKKLNNLKELIEELKRDGIKDQRILEAFEKYPRELFVSKDVKNFSYQNSPLPIGHSQTISQPYIVAYMTEKLEIKPEDRVLEIGTGSGFQTAILSHLAKEVFSVERIIELYESAKKRLEELCINNVKLKLGDGKEGWLEYSPFDKIMVTAAAKEMPDELLLQLRNGGIAIAPVGDYMQYLYIYKKRDNKIEKIRDIAVSFVPLI